MISLLAVILGLVIRVYMIQWEADQLIAEHKAARLRAIPIICTVPRTWV